MKKKLGFLAVVMFVLFSAFVYAADIPVPGDYDGDGKTDIAVWRPSDGNWFIIPSHGQHIPYIVNWGSGVAPYNDVPVPGDYDGDGKTDVAVWRPSEGNWYILKSKTNSVDIRQWGSAALGDIPIPGDYDGDGITDIAVFRPGEGNWFIIQSSTGKIVIKQWGE